MIMTISQDSSGKYWIEDVEAYTVDEGTFTSYGPYFPKKEAEQAIRGLERSAKLTPKEVSYELGRRTKRNSIAH